MPENTVSKPAVSKPNPDTLYDKIGIAAIVLSFLIIPVLKFGNEFIWIKTTVLISVTMILTFLWLIRGVDRKEIVLPKTSIWLPMLMMIAVVLVHIVHVTDIWRAIDMMIRLGANIFFWFFTLLYVRKKSHIKWIIVAMAISVFIVSMYGIMQFYEILPCPYDIYGEKDPSSTIGLTNFSAEWIISFVGLLIFSFFLSDFNIETKTMLFFLFLPTYFYFVLTKGRAAWMGFIISSLVVFGFFIYQWVKLRAPRGGGPATLPGRPAEGKSGTVSVARRAGVLATLGVLVISGGIILSVSHFGKQKQFASIYSTVKDVEEPHAGILKDVYDLLTSKLLTKDTSINFRFMAWRSTFDAWKHNPLIGVGIGQVEVDIHKYQVPQLQQIISKTYQVFSESHNDWLQILAELGIMGFIAFLWILLNAAYKLVRVAKENIGNEDKFLLALAFGGGIMAVLIAAVFSFPLQEPASSMYFWGLIALSDVIYRGFEDENQQTSAKKQRRLAAPEAPSYLLFLNPSTRGRVPVVIKKFLLTAALMASIVSVFVLPIYAGRTAVAENHIKDGVAYRNRRDFPDAVREFNDAISLNPFEYIYYFHRAIVLFNTGDLQQAIADLDQSLKLSPYFGLAYRLRGGAYFAENNCEKAAPDFEQALKFLPPLVEEIGNQAVACDVRLNRIDDVIKIADLQLKYNNDDKNAYYNLGNAMFLKGDYKDAIVDYQKSVEIDPSFQAGLLNIAMTYYYQKDFESGNAYFEKAKQLNSDNPIVWYDHAVGLAIHGEKRQALENLRKAIGLKPALKMSALQEPSFAQLRDMPEFKRLVGQQNMEKLEQMEKLKEMLQGIRKR
ncbi:MAG: tetratricopeptide repeat protein [Deltaproteobacteria bacterium]|nr:tetratricopeptide repeat protein [Deltaproteobacteria bacterium]MCL5276954.1 tetratricopeptide repeat protein [Deltaproteobacteria bacterium]